MVRNHSCCTATANCLFAPYLSIYILVALVSLYRPECNHLSVEYAFPIVTNQNLTTFPCSELTVPKQVSYPISWISSFRSDWAFSRASCFRATCGWKEEKFSSSP